MNLRQLRYFAVLAEELHFHRAARRLNITQSPLTLAIQELERELGGKLLERTRRTVELTDAGRAFQSDARQILDQVRFSLESTRRLLAKEAAPFRLSFAPWTDLLPVFRTTIQNFCRVHPAIRFSISQVDTGRELEALHSREIDVCIVRGARSPESAGVEYIRLTSEQLMVVLHRDHPLRERTSLSLSDLKEEPFIMQENDHPRALREQLNSLCSRNRFAPRVAHEVREPHMMMTLAAARLGVAILPSQLACMHVSDALMIPLTDPTPADISIVYRSADDDSRLSSFCDIATASAVQAGGDTNRFEGIARE